MIVVLTCTDDFYVPDLVVAAVERRGQRALRVNSDRFPGQHKLTVDDNGAWQLTAAANAFAPAAVWARRRWTGLGLVVDGRHWGACVTQGRALLHAWLRASKGRVVNDVDAEDVAEDKVLQMRVARELGFQIPKTLVSNDPVAVRAFVDEVRASGGQVITKLLQPLTQAMQGGGDFFYTSVVDDEHLAHVGEIVHAPQILQQQVQKTQEWRIQVVGDDVFCGSLPSLARDWRLQTTGQWQKQKLTEETQERCLLLCRRLGLVTGAIDVVVDEAGREWFLEVNPAGEWGFLEQELGFPIADAIARELVRAQATSVDASSPPNPPMGGLGGSRR